MFELGTDMNKDSYNQYIFVNPAQPNEVEIYEYVSSPATPVVGGRKSRKLRKSKKSVKSKKSKKSGKSRKSRV